MKQLVQLALAMAIVTSAGCAQPLSRRAGTVQRQQTPMEIYAEAARSDKLTYRVHICVGLPYVDIAGDDVPLKAGESPVEQE